MPVLQELTSPQNLHLMTSTMHSLFIFYFFLLELLDIHLKYLYGEILFKYKNKLTLIEYCYMYMYIHTYVHTYAGLVKYSRLVPTGDQYILTGNYDFNFLVSIHFLNP